MKAILFGLIFTCHSVFAESFPQLELTSKLLGSLERDKWEMAGAKLDLHLDFEFSTLESTIKEICENKDSIKFEDNTDELGRLSCKLQLEKAFYQLECYNLKHQEQYQEIQLTALSYLTAYSQMGLLKGVDLEALELEMSTYIDLSQNYKLCSIDRSYYKSADGSGGDQLGTFYLYTSEGASIGEQYPRWASASAYIPGN